MLEYIKKLLKNSILIPLKTGPEIRNVMESVQEATWLTAHNITAIHENETVQFTIQQKPSEIKSSKK